MLARGTGKCIRECGYPHTLSATLESGFVYWTSGNIPGRPRPLSASSES